MLCENFKLLNGRNLLSKKLSWFLALSAKVYSAQYILKDVIRVYSCEIFHYTSIAKVYSHKIL